MSSTLKNLPKEHISVSQINLYKACSEKYRKKYINKEEQSNFTNIENLLIGSAFDYYITNRLQGDKEVIKDYANNYFYWKLVELIKEHKLEINESNYDWFFNNWYRLNYSIDDLDIGEVNELLNGLLSYEDYEKLISGYEEELKTGPVKRPGYFELFQNLINYYHLHENEILKNLDIEYIQEEVEYSFERYGKNINLLGFLDLRGHYSDNKNIFIRDWKVYKKSKNINDIQADQDLIYSWLVWKNTGVIPIFEYCCFIFSVKTGEIKHQLFSIQHSEITLNEFERVIYDVIRGINQKVFYKNESSWLCSSNYCEYYNECQKYKDEIKISDMLCAV